MDIAWGKATALAASPDRRSSKPDLVRPARHDARRTHARAARPRPPTTTTTSTTRPILENSRAPSRKQSAPQLGVPIGAREAAGGSGSGDKPANAVPCQVSQYDSLDARRRLAGTQGSRPISSPEPASTALLCNGPVFLSGSCRLFDFLRGELSCGEDESLGQAELQSCLPRSSLQLPFADLPDFFGQDCFCCLPHRTCTGTGASPVPPPGLSPFLRLGWPQRKAK